MLRPPRVLAMIWRFPPFELDEERFELRCNGELVKVEPKVFSMLALLAGSGGRLVDKQELYDALWPDEIVSESALAYCVKAARRVLRSGGEDAVTIKAVHGRGFRFLAPPADEAVAAAEAGEAALFLGRQEELARIDDRVEAAAQGAAQVVALAGVPGIGKSSLAARVTKGARKRGFAVVSGNCYEGDDPPAFQPWADVFRDFAESHDPQLMLDLLGAGAADVAQMSPSLRNTLGGIETLPSLDPGQARARFFDSVVAFLGAAAARKPLVVLFEDLHWADRASLLLLETVAHEVRGAPIVWVLTYRDIEVDGDDRLAQLLVTLRRALPFEEVRLDRLSARDTAELLRSVLDRHAATDTVAALAELSEGNPLFTLELARHVAEEGAGALVSGVGTQRGKIPIPGGIAGVIARRMRRLSSDCRRVLANAAVIGRTFALAQVSEVYSGSEDDVLDQLEAAMAAGIVEESPDGESYSFTHVLFRQAMYAELGAARRARIHRRIATGLEKRAARQVHPPLAELAYHYFQSMSGDAERAIYYSTAAAADAGRRYAHEEAARLYRQALEALEGDTEDGARRHEVQRCDLLLDLGEAQSLAGDPGGSRESYERAADLARELDAPDRLARAALRGSGSMLQSLIVDDAAIEALEEALDSLRPGDAQLRARVLSRLALTLYYHPGAGRERRLSLSDEAVDIARAGGDVETLYWALISRHWALWGPASARQRLGVIDELTALGESLGSRVMAARAQSYRVGAYLELADMAAVEREIEVVKASAAELRIPLLQWSADYFSSTLSLLRGEFPQAESLRVRAYASGARTEVDNAYLVTLLQTANRCYLQGRMDEVIPEIDPLIAQGIPFAILPCARVLAQWTEGRVAESRDGFRQIMARGLGDIPENNLHLTTLTLLAALASALGEKDAAAELYAAMKPYADTLVVAGNATACSGSTHYHLALCAWAAGDGQATRDHLSKATAVHREIGARSWLVMSLWVQGRIEEIEAGEGRSESGVAALDEARVLAAEIGLDDTARWLSGDVPSIADRAKARKAKRSEKKRPPARRRANARR